MTAGGRALFFDDLTPEVFSGLRRESGLEPLEPELLECGLGRSLLTLRCEEDGKTLGMLRVVGDGALVLVLCDVLVIPARRGQGIGRLMVGAALERLRRGLPEGKWVSVLLTCDPARERFYGHFGFRTLDGGVQGTAMQMFVKGGRTDTGNSV